MLRRNNGNSKIASSESTHTSHIADWEAGTKQSNPSFKQMTAKQDGTIQAIDWIAIDWATVLLALNGH